MTTYTDRVAGARSSLAFKAPCRVKTTTNITLSGFQTVGGVTLAAGDSNLRVLVAGQDNASENGIWDASATAWTRARDFNGANDVVKGTRVQVIAGTTSGEWIVDTADPITIGTTALSFVAGAGRFRNPLDAESPGYMERDISVRVGEGNVSLRDIVGDGATPSSAEWTAALQKAHDDLRATGGTVYFSEPITLSDSINWDGFVSLKGTSYAMIHRFQEPEPYMGAILLGTPGADLGLEDYGWGGGYLQANGLINIKLDTTILANTSVRPRAHTIFENFGIYGNGLIGGTGIRNVGTMYLNFNKLSMAWLPDWGIYNAGRGDISPGSSNGCRLSDVIITSCGNSSELYTSGGLYWGSPDGFCENVQAGGNFGVGVRFSNAGNSSAEQIHAWNNSSDNIHLVDCHNFDLHLMAYDGAATNVAVMGTTEGTRLRGAMWHPNRSATTDVRTSSSIYIEDTVKSLAIDCEVRGENHNVTYASQTAWTVGEVVTSGVYRVANNKRYVSSTSGTTGATAPSHTTGTVSDGGVSWTFVHGYGLYGILHNTTVSGAGNDLRMSISGATRIHGHRNADVTLYAYDSVGPMQARRNLFPTSASPENVFVASSEDYVWRVIATRGSTNKDLVMATVIGGATPVIIDKVQNGTSIDLAISGSNLQVTTTSGTAVTVLLRWERVI